MVHIMWSHCWQISRMTGILDGAGRMRSIRWELYLLVHRERHCVTGVALGSGQRDEGSEGRDLVSVPRGVGEAAPAMIASNRCTTFCTVFENKCSFKFG